MKESQEEMMREEKRNKGRKGIHEGKKLGRIRREVGKKIREKGEKNEGRQKGQKMYKVRIWISLSLRLIHYQ